MTGAEGGAGGMDTTSTSTDTNAGGAGAEDPVAPLELCNSRQVDTFGDFSGPVAVDRTGRIFAGAFISADGNNQIRTYTETAAGTVGDEFATFASTSSMAALTPRGAQLGILAVAPNPSPTLADNQPVFQAYSATGEAQGEVEVLFTFADARGGASTVFANPDRDEIWLGIPDLPMDPVVTRFIVIGREGDGVDCLSPDMYDEVGAIADEAPSELCVTAAYLANTTGFGPMGWGRHGGPIDLSIGGDFGLVVAGEEAEGVLRRWNVPADPESNISFAPLAITPSTEITAANDVFYGSQAIDLPGDATLVYHSYTVMDPPAGELPQPAEVLLYAGSSLVARYDTSFFSGAVVGTGQDATFVYSGMASLGTLTDEGQALYASDLCVRAE
ncbi:MAG: hypothetical protein AAGA56_05545 [Myxococcota bacterium]